MKPVLTETFFFKNFALEITWFWGWFKDLVRFKRVAFRRFYVIDWNRAPDRDASCKSLIIGPVNIDIWKSGKQLFLQGRGFDNKKLL